MKMRVLILAVVSLTPAIALCDDAPPPPQDVWTGKGQAGYVAARGNTDSTAANAAIDMALLDGQWKHSLHLGGLYARATASRRRNAGTRCGRPTTT